MAKYKDANNEVYEIEDEFKHMLPDGCEPISEDEAAAILNVAVTLTPRQQKDAALGSLVHSFGDGRIIQVRPPETGYADESNIRNAIERMGRLNLTDEQWFMADNTWHPVTAVELQEALVSGQDQVAVIWADLRAAMV